MVSLILQIKASEGVRTYDTNNHINITLRSIRNVIISGSIPLSIAPPFIETNLKITEADWYTFGALICIKIPTPETPILDIEIQENKALRSGILIRVNTLNSLLKSHWLEFPAGSLHPTGSCIRINLSRLADQQFDIEHRIRAQQLLIETEIKIREERILRANAALPAQVRRPDTPIPPGVSAQSSNSLDPFISTAINNESST